jgi:histone acetyltransferase (RNA polymerase elongator complex component)
MTDSISHDVPLLDFESIEQAELEFWIKKCMYRPYCEEVDVRLYKHIEKFVEKSVNDD